MRRTRIAGAIGLWLWAASVVSATQDAGGAVGRQDQEPPAPAVEGWLTNLTRVESWRFFQPPSPEVDPNYTFTGNRADLGIRARGVRVDLAGAFRYVRLERLPTDAIGPGGLGTGPFYHAATGLPYSYQVFVTDLSVAWHTRDRRLGVTIGRMPYTSGAEGEGRPGLPPAPRVAEVRRLALDGRTMGTFEWSLYQRRFDGARVDWSRAGAYAGAGLFLPSQGGFEESANLPMPRLQVGSSWVGWSHGAHAESQVFGLLYRDRRAIDIRPDNAALATSRADISVWTSGLSHVRRWAARGGDADLSAWGAVQAGDWYGESHRAWSATLQGGYLWISARWQPWLRGGWSMASGDGAARDGRHGTWFPMLADTRAQALSMVYAPMNLRDVFVQALARPHERARLRVDLHRLDLANAADRWYQGSGATARNGRFFGFTTRPAGGHRALGTMLEGTADVRVSRYWSLNGYLGRMWGGPVVRTSFAGDRLLFWYVENVLELRLRTASP